jgi:hypothetical protein
MTRLRLAEHRRTIPSRQHADAASATANDAASNAATNNTGRFPISNSSRFQGIEQIFGLSTTDIPNGTILPSPPLLFNHPLRRSKNHPRRHEAARRRLGTARPAPRSHPIGGYAFRTDSLVLVLVLGHIDGSSRRRFDSPSIILSPKIIKSSQKSAANGSEPT